jgi:hypothetical protein
MRDNNPTGVLAENIELAVNETTVRATEIAKSALPSDVADMSDGALGEGLSLRRGASIRRRGDGERTQSSSGKAGDRGKPLPPRWVFSESGHGLAASTPTSPRRPGWATAMRRTDLVRALARMSPGPVIDWPDDAADLLMER